VALLFVSTTFLYPILPATWNIYIDVIDSMDSADWAMVYAVKTYGH
jgi:hypothetical protein